MSGDNPNGCHFRNTEEAEAWVYFVEAVLKCPEAMRMIALAVPEGMQADDALTIGVEHLADKLTLGYRARCGHAGPMGMSGRLARA